MIPLGILASSRPAGSLELWAILGTDSSNITRVAVGHPSTGFSETPSLPGTLGSAVRIVIIPKPDGFLRLAFRVGTAVTYSDDFGLTWSSTPIALLGGEQGLFRFPLAAPPERTFRFGLDRTLYSDDVSGLWVTGSTTVPDYPDQAPTATSSLGRIILGDSGGGSDERLMVSTNGGANWSVFASSVNTGDYHGPAADPFNDVVMCSIDAGTTVNRVDRFTNNGSTRTTVLNVSSSTDEATRYILWVNGTWVLIRRNCSTLYSTDNGNTWTAGTFHTSGLMSDSGKGVSSFSGAEAIVPSLSSTIPTKYSTDGITWTDVPLPPGWVRITAAGCLNPL